MFWSKYFIPTSKEIPSGAKIPSHQLMLRAGMIKQESAGIYSWLPLGLKVLKKIENIDIAEIAIISSANLIVDNKISNGFILDDIKGVKVDVKKANGSKCNRCWKFYTEVNHDGICKRCADVIKK